MHGALAIARAGEHITLAPMSSESAFCRGRRRRRPRFVRSRLVISRQGSVRSSAELAGWKGGSGGRHFTARSDDDENDRRGQNHGWKQGRRSAEETQLPVPEAQALEHPAAGPGGGHEGASRQFVRASDATAVGYR